MAQTEVTLADELRVHGRGQGVLPKFAAFGGSSSGDITVVGAVAGHRIRVIGGFWQALSTCNIYWASGAGGTAIAGSSGARMANAANGGMVLPIDPTGKGYFESSDGAALVVNANTSGLSGAVTYFELQP